jgi:sec-independent protein translocase protein TatA
MFGIGMPELMIILVIIMVIFGAGKLPTIGENLGKAIRGFKNTTREIDESGAALKKSDPILEKK